MQASTRAKFPFKASYNTPYPDAALSSTGATPTLHSTYTCPTTNSLTGKRDPNAALSSTSATPTLHSTYLPHTKFPHHISISGQMQASLNVPCLGCKILSELAPSMDSEQKWSSTEQNHLGSWDSDSGDRLLPDLTQIIGPRLTGSHPL
ncbi:hypothetical protein LENED_003946 [Lentinula edodes]|uniref:Uncharacterized protein n=1 Tax=Lentinula edodes TaxID=5353 RepID=A0A1Q3E4Y2_LENED|nr:hypothetical protein LENED_003946 [Lentinula edodes]